MRQIFAAIGLLIAITILYLLIWPVPVNPVTWDAPTSQGYVDPFEVNDRLRFARAIELGGYSGPEDAVVGLDGNLYATTSDGIVLRIHPHGQQVSVFAETGGRPLGIETDSDGALIVANSYLGLQRITADGVVTTLLDEIDGKALVYANNLAVADNGIVYFSESSVRFGARQSGGTLAASMLDIVEHGGQGRVIKFDIARGHASVLLTGLNYANGVALSEDQSYLLVNETGHYRILRHWLEGPRSGTTEVVIENLPGFPDNIENGDNGRFWIGLVAPRNQLLDRLSDQPFLRQVLQRLPAKLRPKPAMSSHVFAMTGDGVVLMNLQDSKARFPMLTGVIETRDALYLTTLVGPDLARIYKRDL